MGSDPDPCSTSTSSQRVALADDASLVMDLDLRCHRDGFGDRGVGASLAPLGTFVAVADAEGTLFDLTPSTRSITRIGLGGALGLAVVSQGYESVMIAGENTRAEGLVEAFADWPFPSPGTVIDDGLAGPAALVDVATGAYHSLVTWHVRASAPDMVIESEVPTVAAPAVSQVVHRIPGEPGRVRATLTPDGRTQIFNATPNPGELLARVGEEDRVVRPQGPHASSDYRPARSPQSIGIGPTYLLSVLDGDGLRIMSDGADELLLRDHGLADSVTWQPRCSLAHTPSNRGVCPATCHEAATGVMPRAHAIARLPGGVAFVVYVVKRADHAVEHLLSADGTTCSATITADDSRFDLVGAHVDLATGGAHELMRVPIARFPGAGEGTADPIDVVAEGNDVVVVARVEDARGWKVRALGLKVGVD